MTFSFLNPTALLLLALLPAVWFLVRHSRAGLEPGRKIASLVVRMLIVLLLVLALAEMQMVRETDRLAVIFCYDNSESVPADLKRSATEYLKQKTAEMKKNDMAGMVVFGGDASMELSATNLVAIRPNPSSVVETRATNISAAVRLALAAFPEGTQRRMVLLTDGNENQGTAMAEAENARVNGVKIDVLPLSYGHEREVLFESMVLPAQVQKNETFDVKMVVNALQDGKGRLQLFENGELVANEEVEFSAGKNVFVIPRKIDEPGFKTYEAVITTDRAEDSVAENNRAYAFTYIQGEPKVLYIEADEAAAGYLIGALEQENIRVEARNLAGLPTSVAELQNFDSLVFSNVPAYALSRDQMKMIASAVRDLGLGFVMIGGDESFGAGGWQGTPIEEILPVSMDIPQRKVMPKGALAVILHTCEFADGNTWAKEIAKAALHALSKHDLYGVLVYDMRGERWAIPLVEASDKARLVREIDTLNPLDMPSFDPTLQHAYAGLKNCSAALRHIVIISDGDPSQPSPGLATAIVNAKITISTVCINPHSPRDSTVMQQLSIWGKGRHYDVVNPRHLPQIFVKEAAVIRKSLIFEETFIPRTVYFSEVIRGLAAGEIPSLHGYVATSPKPRAEVPMVSPKEDADPILAHWRHGMGKTAAFTSDAKNRWGANWVTWAKYAKFWGQVVRWTLRETGRGDLRVVSQVRDGQGVVTVDAVDREGKFVNFMEMRARLVDPEFEGRDLRFEQTGPGRYEARFPADQVGPYMVNIEHQGESGVKGQTSLGVAVSYAAEYKDVDANVALLTRLAESTGGRLLTPADDVFLHDATRTRVPQDLWPTLLWLAVLLFPLDVFLRRVMVDMKEVRKALEKVAAHLPLIGARFRKERPAVDPTLSALLARKESLRKQEAERKVFQASEEELKESPAMPTTFAPSVGAPGKARPAEPAARRDKPAEVAKAAGAEDEDGYTNRLLKAKKRAMEDMKKKPGE